MFDNYYLPYSPSGVKQITSVVGNYDLLEFEKEGYLDAPAIPGLEEYAEPGILGKDGKIIPNTAKARGPRQITSLGAIYDLLEHKEAVLLPIMPGHKMPAIGGWQNLTYEQTQTPHYQKLLNTAFSGSAIGVQLGNGIHAIDIDNDELANRCQSVFKRNTSYQRK
jgi:hypothetical protein